MRYKDKLDKTAERREKRANGLRKQKFLPQYIQEIKSSSLFI